MTDAELEVRLRSNLVAYRQFQAAHGTLRSLMLPGLWAFAQPNHPRVMTQQQVFFEEEEALADALPVLEDFYRSLGVPHWRVWVPPGNPTGQMLSRAGFRAEGGTPAMGLGLVDAPLTPPSLSLEQLPSQEELMLLNVEAFGPGSGIEPEPWQRQPFAQVHVLGAREDGRLVVGGLAHDLADTVGVYLVATLPAARGRGLATELMRGLLLAARLRGQTAAVLQSTDLAQSLYRRLGFRDLGAWVSWVRRLE